MDLASLVQPGGSVDGRANQWMAEHHSGRQRQQLFRFDGVAQPTRGSRAARPPATPAPDRPPGRPPPRATSAAHRGKPRQPPRVALLDAGGQRHRGRQAKSARELRRAQPARQLQQGERVPARLGDDPLQHSSSSRAGKTDSNSARASRRPKGATWSSGKPASASPSSRVANTSAILSANRRRATKARVRADALSSHCASSTTHRVAAPRRPRPAGRGPPARPGTDSAPAPALSPNATPSASCWGCGRRSIELEERRTQLLNRRERELHLRLDPESGRSETRAQPRPRTRAARSCRRPLRHAPPTRRRARRARRPAAGRAPRARVPGRATALLTREPVATLRSSRLSMTEDDARVTD